MTTKRKYVEFTLKKYMPCWNLKKVNSTKDVAAKFNLPRSNLHGNEIKKNYDTFKTLSLSR